MPKFYCKVIPAASQVPLHLPFLAASNTLLCLFRFHFPSSSVSLRNTPSQTSIKVHLLPPSSDFNAYQYQDASKPRWHG